MHTQSRGFLVKKAKLLLPSFLLSPKPVHPHHTSPHQPIKIMSRNLFLLMTLLSALAVATKTLLPSSPSSPPPSPFPAFAAAAATLCDGAFNIQINTSTSSPLTLKAIENSTSPSSTSTILLIGQSPTLPDGSIVSIQGLSPTASLRLENFDSGDGRKWNWIVGDVVSNFLILRIHPLQIVSLTYLLFFNKGACRWVGDSRHGVERLHG